MKCYENLKFSLLIALLVAGFAAWPAAAGEALAPQLRRPVAIAASADGRLLYVANRRSGSLSIVDLETKRVAEELELGERISDLVALPHRNGLLATDEQTHQLLLLSVRGETVQVTQRLDVSPFPVCVVVARDGQRGYVSSLWSRRLTVIALPAEVNQEARVIGQLDLPFAPREQLLVEDDSRLIVADSFGGHLAVIDCAANRLMHVREFPAHNIRGLGVSVNGRMLIVSHQMLNELAHTVRNDVHWGLVMSNDLRWLKLAAVLDRQEDLYQGAHMHPLGEAGRATGDPAGLAVSSDGTVIVALGGVDEVAVGKEDEFRLYRLDVGLDRQRWTQRYAAGSYRQAGSPTGNRPSGRRRPTAVTISHDNSHAYVANTFSDSVSVINLTEQVLIDEIPLGPRSKLTLADRGELLFYDANLSHDGWMSCHSCHTDGHTCGLMNDNFSDGSFGAPKRVLSLLGRSGTSPFAWNGETAELTQQIRKSIIHTMQSDRPPSDRGVAALAAYLDTLESPPPLDGTRGRQDSDAVQRGRTVFEQLRCNRCHEPPAYTNPNVYDVGLQDQLGGRRYNPPSLRGISQRESYFHDGRAKSLAEVFQVYGHQVPKELDEARLLDLLVFLGSL